MSFVKAHDKNYIGVVRNEAANSVMFGIGCGISTTVGDQAISIQQPRFLPNYRPYFTRDDQSGYFIVIVAYTNV